MMMKAGLADIADAPLSEQVATLIYFKKFFKACLLMENTKLFCSFHIPINVQSICSKFANISIQSPKTLYYS